MLALACTPAAERSGPTPAEPDVTERERDLSGLLAETGVPGLAFLRVALHRITGSGSARATIARWSATVCSDWATARRGLREADIDAHLGFRPARSL